MAPEGLIRIERVATFADALAAVAGGNEAAVRTLIGLFPKPADDARSLVADDARRGGSVHPESPSG